MGILVRLIGSGVGLAAETVRSSKQKSRSNPSGVDLSPQDSASSSRDIEILASVEKAGKSSSLSNDPQQDYEEPPPSYDQVVELPENHATELIADGKAVALNEKRSSSPGRNVFEDDSDSDSDSEGDEANWALDEAAEEVAAPKAKEPRLQYGVTAQPTIESFCSLVMAKFPPLNRPTNPLLRPVIIPQRRPGARNRGFIHAYAPTLADKGIPQDAFLSFIETFHQATQASPLLNVVFLSAGVVGFVPEPICQITSTVIQFAAGAAIYLQTTQRTHSFLDEMNDRLFKPRGLYAMVMKYIPNGTRPIDVQQADLNTMISKQDAPHRSYQNFRAVNAGRSYGTVEMPDSAPLVFPALDEAAQTQDPATASKLKSSMAFIADYYDKRGQASYVLPPFPFKSWNSQSLTDGYQLHKNPNQRLDMPSPEFATGISNPNHPAFRGSWLTLISGGKIPPKAERKMKRRDERLQAGRAPTRKQERRAEKWARKQKKKMMKQNVLYLMIVNLPTKQEVEAAKAQLQQQSTK